MNRINNNISNNNQLTTNSTVYRQKMLISEIINVFFALFGSLSVAANCVIIIIFLVSAKLRIRKELLLLVALAIADLVYSLGVSTVGYRRIFVIGIYQHLIPRWECVKRIEILLIGFIVIGAQAGHIMTLFISIDRLIAIKWFKRYNDLPPRCYVLCIVGTAFVYSIASYMVGIALQLTSTANYCRYLKMAQVNLTA